MLESRILTFLELCRTKSFTQVAKSLHMTQPAVSQHIKYLEEYYGVKLFQYKNRNFVLTSAGEQLYHYALAAKIDSDVLYQSLKRYSLSTYPLRIGVEDSAGESFFPRALATFLMQNPSLRATVTVANSAELRTMMQDGQIDFVISDQIFSDICFDCIPLFQTDVVCVCGPENPCANTIKEIQELLCETLVLRPEGYPAYYGLNACLQRYNCSIFHFHSLLEINSFAASKVLLHQNQGVGFFYRCLVQQDIKTNYLSEIHISTPTSFNSAYTYYIIKKHNAILSEEQLLFFQFCKSQFENFYVSVDGSHRPSIESPIV